MEEIVTINFIFENEDKDENYIIICKRDDKINDIFNQFSKKTGKCIENLIFYYKGEKIDIKLDKDLKVGDLFKEANVIKLLCFEIKVLQHSKKKPIKNLENCIIDFIDYKIYLKDVKNETILEKLLLDENSYFKEINERKIKCDSDGCKNKLTNKKNELFYRCITCNQNICKLCRKNHSKKHSLIEYNIKDFICNKTTLPYISFCTKCNKDLCEQCKFKHNKTHEFIDLTKILTDKVKRQKNFDKLNEKIKNISSLINKIINKLRKVESNFESYYDIVSYLINKNKNLENFFNYKLYKNLENIDRYNENIINDIDDIEFEKKLQNSE